MSVRFKTVIALVSTLLALVALLYLGQYYLILHNFARIEATGAQKDAERALNAVAREVDHLDILARDWSNWDDTYAYVQDHNEAYYNSNLVPSVLSDAQLNLLLIADLSGHPIFVQGYDLELGQPISIPEFTSEGERAYQGLLRAVDDVTSVKGLVMLGQGPMLVSAWPILTSNGEGPARGTLIMGRFLDGALLGQIAEDARLSLQERLVESTDLPADWSAARAALRSGTPVYVHMPSRDAVSAYTFVPDVDGRPALILQVDAPRDLYRSGAQGFFWLNLITLFMLPLSCFVVLRVMEWAILQRVNDLAHQVGDLDAGGDLSARVAVRGRDELGALGARINEMLEKIQTGQDTIRRRDAYLEGLARAAQALILPDEKASWAAFLEAVGQAARASRAYIFLNERGQAGELLASQKAEWCAPGVTPQITDPLLQHMPYAAGGLGRWAEMLSRGQPIQGRVADFPPSERAVLEPQDIKAILVLPLSYDHSFVGFIGFDQCAEAREWDPAQVDLLRAAAADLSQDLKHRGGEQLQLATYRISEAAQAAHSVQMLFESIHVIVGELMPAHNFYIALYDEARDVLEFPYFVDEYDAPPQPKKPGRGLTEYVLRTGQPLLADPATFDDLVTRGEVDSIGAASVDWLGVPLKEGGKPIGVLVVQSYTEGVRFGEEHKQILQFVSAQAAMAIERKRTEEALRASEETYRTIFETTVAATLITDEHGTILLVNDAFARMTGYTKEEVEGKANWTRFIRSEDVQRMLGYQSARRSAKGAPGSYECVVVDRQGKRKDVYITVALIPGTLKSVASLMDVTELKHAEEARQSLEAQLRQAQKMEAIGVLAGGVAHDFNNLLTVILGNAELGLDCVQPGDPFHKEFSTILRAGRRGASLTQQLLAFSRQKVLDARPIDINERVTEFAQMLRRLIGVEIQLDLNLTPDLPTVQADASALDQVLMNLTINARDAMPQGGTLRIETARVTLSAEDLRSYPDTKPGEYARIAVADTGVGIDEKAQKHLFEPFFTTKEVGKGTGLGLSVVYGIIQQHHGLIEVHSQPGRGTRFDVYLPMDGI